MTTATRTLLAHPLFVLIVGGLITATGGAVAITITVKADLASVQAQVAAQQKSLDRIDNNVQSLLTRPSLGMTPTSMIR